MKISVRDVSETRVATDALVLPLLQRREGKGVKGGRGVKGKKTGHGVQGVAPDVDRAFGGIITSVLASGEFEAKKNTTLLLHCSSKAGPKRVLLLGLGSKEDASPEGLRQAGGKAATALQKAGLKDAALSTRLISSLRLDPSLFVEGALLSLYKFDSYKKTEDKKTLSALTVLSPNGRALAAQIKHTDTSARAVNFARDLINTPSNDMTPAVLAKAARAIAAKAGKKMTIGVINRKSAERLGMGAYVSVAKGSHEPPAFIVLQYKGGGPKTPPIVLVGKAVTFDSGGISIKPSNNMEKMKYDMSGGAAVLGALKAASEAGLKINIVGLIPATENMPGGSASRPGDIVKAIGGKTIEIINTDAEGRLLLADALGYAKRFKPKAVVDIATLTGACTIALGSEAAAMMGNDDTLIAQMKAASEAVSERVWHMPIYPEYKDYMKSNVADIKNSGGGNGSLVTAAYFLSEFVEDMPWLHLDIAGTAWTDKGLPYCPKGATGFGVRLLLEFLKKQV